MTIAYPATIPLDDITKVVSILSGGTVADVAVVAKSVWTVTGYVLGLTLGEPVSAAVGFKLFSVNDDSSHTDAPSVRLTNMQGAAILQALVIHQSASGSGTFKAEGVISDFLRSDLVKQLAALALPILLDLLKKLLLGL